MSPFLRGRGEWLALSAFLFLAFGAYFSVCLFQVMWGSTRPWKSKRLAAHAQRIAPHACWRPLGSKSRGGKQSEYGPRRQGRGGGFSHVLEMRVLIQSVRKARPLGWLFLAGTGFHCTVVSEVRNGTGIPRCLRQMGSEHLFGDGATYF